MQIQSERVNTTITQTEPSKVIVKPIELRPTVAVPDNCANCPESSCCPHASDKFHGKAGYDD